MTTVIVIPDPLLEGIACKSIVERTSLTEAAGLELYRALLADTMKTLDRSTVDILVNYPTSEDVPSGIEERDSEGYLREIARSAMSQDRYESVRFEPQVGSDRSAKAGNAITHLLREEGVQSAAVLDPCVPGLPRSIIDEAALKLRRSDVILGPSRQGEIYFAGFTEPIDFTDVFAVRPLEEVTRRAREADLSVDFLRMRENLSRPADMVSVLSRLKANRLADKPLPENLWETIRELGIDAEDGAITIDAERATDSP